MGTFRIGTVTETIWRDLSLLVAYRLLQSVEAADVFVWEGEVALSLEEVVARLRNE